MKNQLVVTIAAVFISISAHCQENNSETRMMIESVETANLWRQFSKRFTNTEGSPYLQKMFSLAKISTVSKSVLMRYDVFSDEFEFIDSKKDTLLLIKSAQFNSITFTGTNTKYQLVNYINDKKEATLGYLIHLYEKNGYTLFKKQNISYFAEKKATVTFQKTTPAQFVPSKDSYYLKNGDKGISEFPSNKKNLLKLFPDKKDDIEAFLKKNAIDFSKESDKIKIVDFLAL